MEQSRPFMKFHLVKDGIAYRVEIPKASREISARHRYSFDFTVCEHDSDVQFTKYVHLFYSLYLEKTDLQRIIIAVRALYGLLGTSDETRELSTNFPPEFLSFENTNIEETRQKILNYAQQRDKVLFDEAFHVIEFISAIHSNPRQLVRQLQFWDKDGMLRFDRTAGVWGTSSTHDWEDYIFRRMLPDRDRLQNTPLEVDWPDELTVSDEELASMSANNHRYYKLIDTYSELDGDFAFVLMPFSDDEFPQAIYHDVIKPLVMEVLDINCMRVDEDPTSQNAQDKIYSHIVKSKLVIVEVSTQNPNVMFEFGQAAILEKDFILTCYNEKAVNKVKKLAFDFANIHTHFYDNPDELRTKLRQALEAFKKMQPKQTT